jgi:DNA gyrase inhibitor GyrI
MRISVKFFRSVALLLAAVGTTGCSIMGNYEEPQFSVIKSQNNIEIRQYKDALVAEVTVSGDRSEAANKGFRLLADYIFGNNISQEGINMTAPVTQSKSEKISMTAPVAQQKDGTSDWRVQFFMPSKYTQNSLPKPINDKVRIIKLDKRQVAAIRFSGRWAQNNLSEHDDILKEYLSQDKHEILSGPIYAFYNAPFTPWFIRRNEVMYILKNEL